MGVTATEFLPIELVFNPNWWYRTTGISFDESFYLDREKRIQNDVTMRRVLYERYGEMGPGEPDPQPRPMIGSMHVAGGFIIPALLGADTAFEENAAPWGRYASTYRLRRLRRWRSPISKKPGP